MLKVLLRNKKSFSILRCLSSMKESNGTQFQSHLDQADKSKIPSEQPPSFYETVFKFPFIKYIVLLNRLKIYQLTATSIAVPSCALMEILNTLPEGSVYSAGYIGLTGSILLSLASLPFKNTIGYLYIRADERKIKISSVDFWGKRKDRVIPVDDWCPLNDIPPKLMDAIYLTPLLADGTKYKLFVKYGTVLNSKKIGHVLE